MNKGKTFLGFTIALLSIAVQIISFYIELDDTTRIIIMVVGGFGILFGGFILSLEGEGPTAADISEEVYDSRKLLRNISNKYLQELGDVLVKIDNFLEAIGGQDAKD